MFEPDGSPVKSDDGVTEWIAITDAFVNNEGNYQINIRNVIH